MHIILRGVVSQYNKLKDRSFKISIETGELGPEQVLGIDKLFQTDCYIAIGDNHLNYQDIKDDIPSALEVMPPKGKSPSQRLREVMYVYWEQGNADEKDFDKFYQSQMEKIIGKYKEKLE